MGLSSSLNAGVLGLAVNATKLGTISDNIANSKTNGYKRSDVTFQDMVLNQTSGAFSAGGVNATTFRDVGAQSALTTTANAMDLAVSGAGLMPVTDIGSLNQSPGNRSLMFTSTGSFSTDENGYLRTLGGNFMMGWPVDSSGSIGNPVRDSVSSLEPVQINLNQFAAEPTTEISLGVNLPATDSGTTGTTYTLPVEYFDNLGASETLTVDFETTATANQWTVNVYDSASTTPAVAIATFTVNFDNSAANGGNVSSVTAGTGATWNAGTGIVSFTTASGNIDMQIDDPTGGTSPLTQLGSSYAPLNVIKDGTSTGTLSSLEVDEEGMLSAIYDTGFTRVVYQIPLGNVPNYNGLQAAGNSAFTITDDSGDFYLWDAGDGPVGLINGFTLAESATDIAQELTDLIETQRAYSSNAKIIQTVDEMLQETTDIIR